MDLNVGSGQTYSSIAAAFAVATLADTIVLFENRTERVVVNKMIGGFRSDASGPFTWTEPNGGFFDPNGALDANGLQIQTQECLVEDIVFSSLRSPATTIKFDNAGSTAGGSFRFKNCTFLKQFILHTNGTATIPGAWVFERCLLDGTGSSFMMQLRYWGQPGDAEGTIVAKNCIFKNAITGSIRLQGQAVADARAYVHLFNNTFIGGPALYGIGQAMRLNMVNNVLGTANTGLLPLAASYVDTNAFGYAFPAGVGGSNIQNVDLTTAGLNLTNPAAGDYTLPDGSVLVNTGTDDALTDDFNGDPRPVAEYDIGAYENQVVGAGGDVGNMKTGVGISLGLA